MRNTFEGSTDITIDVTPDQIGNHVAQITLINPVDTLDFNFDSDVKGNFHLVFHEMEDGEEGALQQILTYACAITRLQGTNQQQPARS